MRFHWLLNCIHQRKWMDATYWAGFGADREQRLHGSRALGRVSCFGMVVVDPAGVLERHGRWIDRCRH